jgi:hypothetical protein
LIRTSFVCFGRGDLVETLERCLETWNQFINLFLDFELVEMENPRDSMHWFSPRTLLTMSDLIDGSPTGFYASSFPKDRGSGASAVNSIVFPSNCTENSILVA